ncbi:MAG: hypothetical protein MHPSP_002044, partial [Paramarteilia canceri]
TFEYGETACRKSMKAIYKKCKKKIPIIGPILCLPLKIKAICKITKKLEKISKIDCEEIANKYHLEEKFQSSVESLENLKKMLDQNRNESKTKSKTKTPSRSETDRLEDFEGIMNFINYIINAIRLALGYYFHMIFLYKLFISVLNTRIFVNQFIADLKFQNCIEDSKNK